MASGFNYLLKIEAPNGDRFVSLQAHVYSGDYYEPKLSAAPTISEGAPGLTDGVVGQWTLSATFEDAGLDFLAWSLARSDGSFEDVVGSVVTCWEVELPSGAETQVFKGQIASISRALADGLPQVSVTANADGAGVLDTLVPKTLVDADLFGMGVEKVPEDGVGRPVPFVVGATSEHYLAVPVVADEDTPRFDYLLGEDLSSDLCRMTVNAIYSDDGGALRVIDPAEYEIDRTTYTGFVVAKFTNRRNGRIYVDAEVAEFDTSIAARHWRFRQSLIDDASMKVLVEDSGLLAHWTFDDTLADASGNGHTLVDYDADTPNYADLASGERGIEQPTSGGAVERVKLVASASGDTFCDWGASDDWSIVVRVGAESERNELDGWIVSKLSVTSARGWGLYISNGRPSFALLIDNGGGSTWVQISGDRRISDGSIHEIAASVDRTSDVATLWLDGVKVGEADISSYGTLSNASAGSGPLLTVLGYGSAGDGLFGGMALADLAIYEKSYGAPASEIVWETGHSESSVSAIRMASASAKLVDADSSDLNLNNSLYGVAVIGWVKVQDAPASARQIAGKWDGSAGWKVEVDTDGTLKMTISDGVDTVTASGSTDIGDNEWHPIACEAISLSANNRTLNVCVDGKLDGTQSGTITSTTTPTSADFEIHGGGGGTSDIIIDEIAVVFGALSVLGATDVRSHAMVTSGNPVRAARSLLSTSMVGLGETVDSTTFDAAEDTTFAAKIRCDTAMVSQSRALDAIQSFLRLYGAFVRKEGSTWKVYFSHERTAASNWGLGYNDGNLNNVFGVGALGREDAAGLPKLLRLRYRPQVDVAEPGERVMALETSDRTVSSAGGEERVIDIAQVRRADSADRVAHYMAESIKADRSISVQVTDDFRAVRVGDRVDLTIADYGMSADEMIVREVSRSGDELSLTVQDYSAAALTYSAGTLPTEPDGSDRPDYRYTIPPAPTNLALTTNAGFSWGTRFIIQWNSPTGALAEELVSHFRVYFRLPDNADTGELDWHGLDFSNGGQEVVGGGLWYAPLSLYVEPGETVEVYVVCVSIYGLESAPAALASDPDTTLLTATADTASVTRSRSVLGDRVDAIEGATASGSPYVRKLSDVLFDGAQATFTNLMPVEPELSSNEVVLIHQGVGVLERVASSPSAGQFSLSGASNRDVEFGYAPASGDVIYAIFVAA